MGFFFDEAPPPPKRLPASAARKAQAARPRGCEGCALRAIWPRLASPRMALRGNLRSADILILGEAPRPDDDRAGGAFLDKYWAPILGRVPGFHRDRIAYQNLARCAPMNEFSEATASEIHSCGDHLTADMDSLPKLKAILGIGQAVLSRFFPGAQLRDVFGMRMPVRVGEKMMWFYPVFDLKHLKPRKGWWSDDLENTPQWPVFCADVKAFFKDVDRWPAAKVSDKLVPKNVLLPAGLKEAREILAEMKPGLKGIDIETGNLPKRSSELRPYNVGAAILCGAISDGSTTISFPCSHPEGANDWGGRLLVECANAHPWTAHNLSFEYAWLKSEAIKLGIEWAPAAMEDSIAICRLINRRPNARGLDDNAMLHFGVLSKALTGIDAAKIMAYPLHEILPYCGIDAQVGVMLTKKLLKRVDPINYRRLVDSTIATADMALYGLPVDFKMAAKLKAHWEARMMEYEEQARSMFEVKAFERELGRRFQIGSGMDVGQVIVDFARIALPKTKGEKQYDTSEAAMKAALAADDMEPHPLIDTIIEYREAAKMVSTYIGPTLEARERCIDQRIHPVYDTTKVETLRFACEDPNQQNWPKRNKEQMKLRKQIKAGFGTLIYRIDYKALEARMIACATKDATLCRNTINGVDIHGQWRDKLLAFYPRYMDRLRARSGQTDEAKILKAGRDQIKTDFVFASFFGSPAASCAERTGVPPKHMERLQEELWLEYPDVKRWIRKQRQLYKDTGSTWLLTGVERHGVMMGNEPINTPIQGTGAAVVSEALNECAKLARDEKDFHFHPRIQIHDDLSFILPDDNDTDRYMQKINEICVALRFDWQIVPLGIEGAIGYNWADMHECCALEGEYVR